MNDPTFDFETLADEIHIFGIGGIGSHEARLLTKGGLQAPIHLWDGDIVEDKNRRNQTYHRSHVGLLKVAALAQQIALEWGEAPVIQHPEFVTEHRKIAGVVFLCTDSMSSRRCIWETCIKGNDAVPLMIETRMDGVSGLIHVVDPCNADHQHEWERYSSFRDEDAINETAGCGGPAAVLPSASFMADLSVWQLMRYAAIKAGFNDVLNNQIRVELRPPDIKLYRW